MPEPQGSRITLINARAGEIETYQAGNADHLALCLHGFPEHAVTWYGQINMLTKCGYTVWAPNLRGYGGSVRPNNTAGYRIDELLQDIDDLIHHWGDKPVTIIGHDWGALLAWFYAMKYPGRIAQLVSISSNHPASLYPLRDPGQINRAKYIPALLIPGLAEWSLAIPARIWSRTIDQALRASGAMDERALAIFQRERAKPGAIRAMANYYRANIDLSWWQQQPLEMTIPIPVLSINGALDPYVDLDAVSSAQQWVPRQKAIVINKSNHWPHIEQRDQVNEHIANWLESSARPTVA